MRTPDTGSRTREHTAPVLGSPGYPSGAKRRIVENLLILGTGQIATWLLSMIYLLLIGRYLGPERQGELALAGAMVGVLALGISLGMETRIIREVARAPERAGALVGAALRIRLLLLLPALAALFLGMRMAHFDEQTRTVALILALSTALGSLNSLLMAALQGLERMSYGVRGAVGLNLLEVVFALILIAFHGGVVLFALLTVPATLILLWLGTIWFRRHVRVARHLPPGEIRAMLIGSLPFWASGIFLSFYLQIDSVILGAVAGSAAVGIYAPATRLFAVAFFLPGIVGTVTQPLLSRLGVTAGSDFRQVTRKSLALLLLGAMPLTIGLCSFSGPLILGIFGPAYRPSIPVLTVLGLCVIPSFLSMQAASILAAANRQWVWTAVMATCCVLNPLLNLAIIPRAVATWHNGALGAAYALLATELLMGATALIVLRTILWDRAFLRLALQVALAGAGQALVIRLGTPIPAPLAQALGLALYLGLVLRLGALPPSERTLIWHVLRAKLGRRGEALDTKAAEAQISA